MACKPLFTSPNDLTAASKLSLPHLLKLFTGLLKLFELFGHLRLLLYTGCPVNVAIMLTIQALAAKRLALDQYKSNLVSWPWRAILLARLQAHVPNPIDVDRLVLRFRQNGIQIDIATALSLLVGELAWFLQLFRQPCEHTRWLLKQFRRVEDRTSEIVMRL